MFDDFVYRIYPIELEIKDTTESDMICPFLWQGICIYIGLSIFMKDSWTNSLNLSFSLECGIVV
jgi:hypothetical protein